MYDQTKKQKKTENNGIGAWSCGGSSPTSPGFEKNRWASDFFGRRFDVSRVVMATRREVVDVFSTRGRVVEK
ncbi:MAG TPA: hypothetical protein VIK18_09325, partial [Pirellulales bacterium]